jgi:hypothetical protein
MTQTIGNSTKTGYLNPFKIISNSKEFQTCPNHFLVEGHIALQYLGQLSHFSKLICCPNS